VSCVAVRQHAAPRAPVPFQFCFIWRSGPAWGLVDRTRGSRGVDGPREPHKERIRLERLRKTLTAL